MTETRQNTKTGPMPVYMPLPLRSMNEICKQMRVGEDTVRDWIRKGAPIAVEMLGSKAKYSAEFMRLQVWRERGRDC